MLYGGTAFGYTQKPDFFHVSRDIGFWQKVIDKFYSKYNRLAQWHNELVREVQRTGKLIMPTGREFKFEAKVINGEHKWPRTKILNYPVQGTGADLVSIGRVTMGKRIKKSGLPGLFISTVHDSIDLDVPNDMVYNIGKIVRQSILDIPDNFYRLFGHKFNLPINCEIGYGPNLKELVPFENYGN